MSTRVRATRSGVETGDESGSFGEAIEESGGDGVELADVPEGERPQEGQLGRRR